MALYEYRMDDGSIRSRILSMTRAPKIGSRRKFSDGMSGVRIISGMQSRVFDREHTAHSLHRDKHWADPVKCLKGPDGKRLYKRVDDRGRPVFANAHEIREHCAKAGYVYD